MLNITLIQQIFNFLVLLALLNYLLYKPITRYMAERNRRVTETLHNATLQRQEAAQMREEYEARLAESKREAREIIEEATTQGKRLKEEIMAEARAEAERTVSRAVQEIAREKEQARSELQKEITQLVIMATREVAGKTLNEADHRALIEEAIKEVAAR